MKIWKTTAVAVTAAVLVDRGAKADFKVWLPEVNFGEVAIETVGNSGFDPHADRSGEQSQTLEFEYGATRWGLTEREFEFERDAGPGQNIYFTSLTSENLFQLTQRGEYWIDVGFFAEYGLAMKKGEANGVTLGPVLRKDFWGLSNTVNLFFAKDIGHNAATGTQFLWAWETRVDALAVRFGDRFSVEPGFQYYSQPGKIGHFSDWNSQDNRIGPQLFGKVFNIGPGTLEWNAGFLVGLTNAVPKLTPRWQFEYEIHY
jgi:hypothetical protein